MADVSHIYHFVAIDDRLSTSGQPQVAQFAEIKQAGYDVVINLAAGTPDDGLPNEADLVSEQGLDYVHIPVDRDHPESEDFERFAEAMDEHAGKRILVHCEGNKRTSAFVFLYRIIRQGADPSEARRVVQQIWDLTGMWEMFADEVLGEHGVDYYDID